MPRTTATVTAIATTAVAVAAPEFRSVDPAATDPAIDRWTEPHLVAIDPDARPRERLLLFFAGAGGLPSEYTEILDLAAREGFHAVGLRYPNSWSVTRTVCGFSTDPDCHERARLEVLDGVDASPLPQIDVSPANSIRSRIVGLLTFLDAAHPLEGWGAFLDGAEPDWDAIAVAGHSEGGATAAFIASRHEVARVALFAGGPDLFLGPNPTFAPWLATSATPAARYFGLVHELDNPPFYLDAWAIFGMPAFGDPVRVDDASPPYRLSHQLTTALPEPAPGDNVAHKMVIADDFLPRDAGGQHAYRHAWRAVLAAPAPGQAFRVSPAGQSFIDPEILDGVGAVTYQDQARAIWYAELDCLTGGFATPGGRDRLVDTNASLTSITNNGPEFGIDRDGWSIIYNKGDGLVPQVWRADPLPDGFDTRRLTAGQPHLSPLARKDPGSDQTAILALRGTWGDGGTITWFNENTPALPNDLEFVVGRAANVHWIGGSPDFVFAPRTGPEAGQIHLVETATGRTTRLTDDAGFKSDPWGWFAPEYGGELLLLGVIDDAAVGIYRDLGGPFWTRIATLTIPPESEYPIVGSPEPFTVGGRSAISVTIRGDSRDGEPFARAEIWVFGIDDHPDRRFTLRCDDGLPDTGRQDPETLIGRDQAFIYYNRFRDGVIETWGCATGLPAATPASPISCCALDGNADGDLDIFDILAFFDRFAAGDRRIDTTGDGTLDLFDILRFFEVVAGGC